MLRRSLLVLLPVAAISLAQEHAALERSAAAKKPTIPQTRLEVQSSVEVTTLFKAGFTANPTCGADGSIYGRFITDAGDVGDLVAISPSGTRTSFDRNKMTDVNSPVVRGYFVAGSEVYMLVRSMIDRGTRGMVTHPDGRTENIPIMHDGGWFIARYKRDGTYVSAVKFEPPFEPQQIGAFANGDFLVSGITKGRTEPRVAMFQWNGQFIRYIELKGDVRLRDDDKAEDKDDRAALSRKAGQWFDRFDMAVQMAQIVADGPNLLLLRKVPDVPVFSISPGGEATAVSVKSPPEFRLWNLKTTSEGWIGVFMHRISDARGMEYRMMAIDRETGKTTQEFVHERLDGTLACTDGRQFTVLVEKDEKLRIVKLTAGR